MNDRSRNKLFITLAIMIVISSAAVVLVVERQSSETDAAIFPSNYIAISTPQQLSMIGNDSAYPLSGSYYLTNNIDFAGIDTNGGVNVGMSVIVSGTSVTITLVPSSGNVTAMYATSLGTYYFYSSNNTVTMLGIPVGINIVSVFGTLSTGDGFVFSTTINTATGGMSTAFNSNGNFTPIGTASAPFTGIFDGNGCVVSGINIAIYGSFTDYAGLFGEVLNGTISNIGMINSSVTGKDCNCVGGIVGNAIAYAPLSITISNCYNSGSIIGIGGTCVGGIANVTSSAIISKCYNTGPITAMSPNSSCVGGIVGDAGSAIISNCYNTGPITSVNSETGGIAGCASESIQGCYNTGPVISSAWCGGIVGYAGGMLLSNCYNTGSITSAESGAGGIAGGLNGIEEYSSILSKCYNTGSISSYSYTGGIVGEATSISSTLTISNCYNTGSTTSTASAGGIAGGVYSSIDGSLITSSLTIMNCYNTGDVSAKLSDASAGGIVGYANTFFLPIVISNCHFLNGQIRINGSSSADVICGTGDDISEVIDIQASGVNNAHQMTPTLSEALSGNSIYFAGSGGWDFINTWTILSEKNDGYPILKSLSNSVIPDGYTPIFTFNDLMAIRTDSTTLSGKYILMNDITFTDANNVAFAPIGNIGIPFTGIFDGNGFNITGLVINTSSSGNLYVGLFGATKGAQIHDLGVERSKISATSSTGAVFVGGIVGDATISTIQNCYSTGDISARAQTYANVGGIVGVSDVSIIMGSNNTGYISVTAPSVARNACAGGIVGSTSVNSTIENCYNTGEVSVTSSSTYGAYAGGIAGFGSVIIEICYNTGGISAKSLGNAYACGIGGSAGAATIKNCYNTGDISAQVTSSANNAYAGGISSNATSASLENCYNTGNISARAQTYTYAGGIAGYANSAIIENCYFLKGTVSYNAVFVDKICGYPTNPSFSDSGGGGQISGAYSMVQMAPPLQDAKDNVSIYYADSGGWDFRDGGVWTIIEGENNGYPILCSLGYVGPITTPSYKVTLTPGTGYSLMPKNGSSSPVESGGSFLFTLTVDLAYKLNIVEKVMVNGKILMPVDGVYIITNITEDQTVSVLFDPMITSSSISSGGSSVEISGTVDLSAGASYVKVYITFSGGFTIAMASNLGPSGYFYISYSGGLQPISYMVTAYDGIPNAAGSNMVSWSQTNNI